MDYSMPGLLNFSVNCRAGVAHTSVWITQSQWPRRTMMGHYLWRAPCVSCILHNSGHRIITINAERCLSILYMGIRKEETLPESHHLVTDGAGMWIQFWIRMCAYWREGLKKTRAQGGSREHSRNGEKSKLGGFPICLWHSMHSGCQAAPLGFSLWDPDPDHEVVPTTASSITACPVPNYKLLTWTKLQNTFLCASLRSIPLSKTWSLQNADPEKWSISGLSSKQGCHSHQPLHLPQPQTGSCWALRELPKEIINTISVQSSHSVVSDPFCPLFLLPSIFPSVRVFLKESVLRISWPKYCSFSFSISPSNEQSGLISFKIDWFDLLAVQGTQESSPQFKSINSSALSSLYGPNLKSTHEKTYHLAVIRLSPLPKVSPEGTQDVKTQETGPRKLRCRPKEKTSVRPNSCIFLCKEKP